MTMEGSEAPSRISYEIGGRRGLRPVGLEVGPKAVPDRPKMRARREPSEDVKRRAVSFGLSDKPRGSLKSDGPIAEGSERGESPALCFYSAT